MKDLTRQVARWSAWLDPVIAAALFVTCEIEVLVDLAGEHVHVGSALMNVAVVGAMTVPLAWRRRSPLVTACTVMACITILAVTLPDFNEVNSIALVVVFVSYAVAVNEPRSRALVGLGVCLAGFCAPALIATKGPDSWLLGLVIALTTWLAGRAVRAQRTLTSNLARLAALTREQREGRELLALAEERTRVARELHELVAHSVSTMVVQSAAAQRLLGTEPDRADATMAVIEETGRSALIEMRRILGVLSRVEGVAELSPQPGIGQIYSLVERARGSGRNVIVSVEGAPMPLPASVDLGAYRVVEGVLAAVTAQTRADSCIDVVVRFEASEVQLHFAADERSLLRAPSTAIRECVALCGGTHAILIRDEVEHLVVRLPRTFDGVLT